MVDDGIEGYKDLGEEEDWTAEPEEDIEKAQKGKRKKGDGSKEDGQKGVQILHECAFLLYRKQAISPAQCFKPVSI